MNNRHLAAALLLTLLSCLPAGAQVQRVVETPSSTTSTVLQAAATANGNGTALDASGYPQVALTLNCTVACDGLTLVNFEGSADSTNWVALYGTRLGEPFATTLSQSLTARPMTDVETWQVPLNGLRYFRARISDYSAGTLTVTAYRSMAPPDARNVSVVGGVVSTDGSRSKAMASDITGDTLQNAATANGNGTTLSVTGYSVATLTVTGSMVGGTQLNFEVTADGSNWVPVQATQIAATTSFASTTTQSGLSLWRVPVSGFSGLRARISNYSGGTVTVVGRAYPIGDAPYTTRVVTSSAESTVSALLAAGTNTIGKLAANSGVDIGDVDVTSSALPTGAATSANQSTEITALQLIDNLPNTLGSTTSGQSGALALGAVTTAAPSYTTAQTNALSLTTGGLLRTDGSGVTQPVSGTVTANAGTGTFTVGDGAGALTVDGTVAATQSGTWNVTNVSGTVSLPTGASTLAEQQAQTTALQVIDNLPVTQGSATSGQSGALVQGAVTTAAPSYTTAQTSPLSLTTAGALRTDASATTQPVSGTVTVGTFPDNEPFNVAQINGVAPSMGNGASGTGVQRVTIASDSTGQVAVASSALPTGAATSANQTTEITALQLIDNLPNTLGSTTSGQSGALALGAVTTAAPSYTTAQTNALSLTTAGALRVDNSANTQPVSGTVSITANSAVNVAQINGVTPLMGAGNTGTGSQRVTIATDQAALPGFGVGVVGSAPPVNASYVGGLGSGATGGLVVPVPVCDSRALLDMTTATTTELVALTASRRIYICAWIVNAEAATTLTFKSGTGTNCGTGTSSISPGFKLAAGAGWAQGTGVGAVFDNPNAGEALCVTSSAAVNLQVFVKYAKY